MHSYSNYNRKKDLAASERGRQKANARWTKDRARRDCLARATADQFPERLLGRLIVVRETDGTAREFPIFTWHDVTDAKRILKTALRHLIAST